MIKTIKEITFSKEEFWSIYHLIKKLDDKLREGDIYPKNVNTNIGDISISVEIDNDNNYKISYKDISKLLVKEEKYENI